MTIKYALYPNHLTVNPDDHSARVQITGSVNLDGLARRIIDQGSTVTMPDILAVLENTLQAAEGLLLEGYRINLGGLCELFPRLRGVFDGITDGFDSSRHRIELGANPGARLRSAFRQKALVARVESEKPAPVLLNFVDLASGETNGSLTPGNIGTLNGHRLRFDPDDTNEGIFFVSPEENSDYPVTLVQKNKPGQLVFLNPSIPAGSEVYPEVRVHFGSELRTGRLDKLLLV